MPRYIDAEKLKQYCKDGVINMQSELEEAGRLSLAIEVTNSFLRDIDDQPAADVEEVIRCKDCKFRSTETCFARHETALNDFCSCGAKMDGKENSDEPD